MPEVCGSLNFKELFTWNRAAMAKLFWALSEKHDMFWIRWLHAYYIRQRDICQMSPPSRLSWALRKIIAAREHLVVGQSVFVRHNRKFSIKHIYKQMQGDSEKIPWRRVTYNSKATPKAIFITWLGLHDRLSTKTRLFHWNIFVDMNCV